MLSSTIRLVTWSQTMIAAATASMRAQARPTLSP
jgi:hypothetical protein